MTEDKLERKHLMRITVQGPLYDETQKKFLWITDVVLKIGDDKPKSSSYYTDASVPFEDTIKQLPMIVEHVIHGPRVLSKKSEEFLDKQDYKEYPYDPQS